MLPVPHRPQQIPSLSILYLQASLDDVRGWLADHIPVIALVQTLELPYWSRRSAHALVVVGVQETTSIRHF
jgi:hypothetical protein